MEYTSCKDLEMYFDTKIIVRIERTKSWLRSISRRLGKIVRIVEYLIDKNNKSRSLQSPSFLSVVEKLGILIMQRL